jgi:hypothetical protein
MSIKFSNLKDNESLLDVLTPALSEAIKIENVSDEIEQQKKKRDDYYYTTAKGWSVGKIIGMWFLICFLSGFALAVLAVLIYGESYATSNSAMALVTLGVFILPTIGVIAGHRQKKAKNQEKINENCNLISNKINNLNNKLGNTKQCADKIHVIPEPYRYSLAIETMIEYVNNGRAYTGKECMDLYEEQLHRWKMEEKIIPQPIFFFK